MARLLALDLGLDDVDQKHRTGLLLFFLSKGPAQTMKARAGRQRNTALLRLCKVRQEEQEGVEHAQEALRHDLGRRRQCLRA